MVGHSLYYGWFTIKQQLAQHQTTATPSPYSIPTGRGVISEVTPARLLARLVLAFY